MAEGARASYPADITFGELPWLRGHWLDRLPAIDADIALIEKRLESAKASDDPKVKAAIAEALGRPQRLSAPVRHMPPAHFQPKQPLVISIAIPGNANVRLWYRHVNQAERWQSAAMEQNSAAIPASYTDSPYALQYYFEVRTGPERAWLYPGFAPDLANQPYFVVRRA
jgi:hypothetical protein